MPATESLRSASRPGRVAVAALLLMLLSSCSVSDSENLVVSVASSLGPAFEDIAAAYEADHSRVTISLNVASSSRLREQILEGAPVDVFASANVEAMDAVTGAASRTSEPVIFATNRLAIGVPTGNPAAVASLTDFERDGLLSGACVSAVPCGQYADEAFILAGVDPVLDTRTPNAGALVLGLALGELDAGVVYQTDVDRPDAEIDGVSIPDVHNVVALYPIAALSDADGAQRFVDFVLSDDGRAILIAYGFGLP